MARSDDEDDYMSMVVEEPKQKESFTQKKLRLQREAEARGRVPSKAERAAQEAQRRDEALAKSTLDPSNKGFKMMAKLGFKPGDALGKRVDETAESNGSSQARSEPLNLVMKENRGGIGLDNEKKRKIREQAEEAAKKIKREEGDYRDRVREERELRRNEALVRAAQKVVERLDTEAEEEATGHTEQGAGDDQDEGQTEASEGPKAQDTPRRSAPVKPTAQINVLYRGLIRERRDRELHAQARRALQSSLPSSFFPKQDLPGYEDSELGPEDQTALGMKVGPHMTTLEQEVEEEDPELEAFNALDAAERLHKIVVYLRETYRYCFWCKHRYLTDEDLESCPGLTEEDHD
ncbi:hypothetical protein N7468_001974 [Penicillium chermesinum]|uniref:G-patch domain-containing protein n=1 Tax=Penicillium chermesinum TaxID=63820 RepID=A0A9W9PHL1_9EURO|nr:uncharacterized protein N7468_001974 [Penicillium chermesinum]KAJ5246991.1 hypothetical protein N7468_001974 [Penicillium chermesinum]KAJ6145242.1 hypothetical protein N7470_009137 [Penicillium chermesinum]